MIGSVRQHELTEAAEMLNAQLQAEITHRKEVEREVEARQDAIRASEQRYRGLVEAIPQIVWTATPDGIVGIANSRWREHLGLNGGASKQLKWSDLVHPDERNRFLQLWSEGLKSQSAFQIEHRLRNSADGGFRWFLSRAVPARLDDRGVAEWLGTSTDVDDQKRHQLAVYHKNKLESLGILAGGLAHDFNNLLVGVLSGASYAASVLPADHPLQKILDGMVRAGEKAANLTRQMLEYAGKGQLLIEQIEVGELVRKTCDSIRTSVPSHVRFILQADPNLPPVDADSSQMEQVLMNLILNAAESIDEATGGSVTVKTHVTQLDAHAIRHAELVIGRLIPGPYVVLEVQDSGSGMDDATKARAFDPFFTTRFTGRGLGLSAVEGILRIQNGALQLESSLGRGSTFRVYLPVSVILKRDRAEHAERSYARGAGTVLIVDDEEVVRQVAGLGLQNGGFTVRLADSGEEAIRILLSEAGSQISVIVLDWMMSGMSGKDVVQRITELGISVPVLITSGFDAAEICEQLSDLEIAGFIQKPFTGAQLASCVSGVLRGRAQMVAGVAAAHL
jgi:PAS domain S-box-containing protein